ncbi:GAF domain-containing protein [Anabaena cylindrica FACHB-243]|uniref:histidine kinase n=1 Tax=Anabaena cylindrica (strain ATCC 27899 / PCC 7122) TaxID=272123 RepID=K9ZDR8_ANACC|nr:MULTISPECIES: GAF domain-containing protein [Anabaena]AFZ57358.1 GAF sensor signal transduction histidine kinase [Anabaena cylindrica PCC 7122]MBD2421026.1 GAF domain-containing protein [Anabaena cylindrica FACHB-243]MBY5280730.1 GAF domain-containing protein [Anabaena sp. CCAP 1446/1C]MBY5306403.1 GAF domain-containing protein [Anabaena sp. CCAP 1446/1C]MCM2405779.1 GAF domain-containing protein [Anabaena sp. CCAP 1446/1C]
MKKRLLSFPQYVNDVEKLQEYPAKLMQQQEKTGHALVQDINHIIANSANPSLMLQEIAHLLGLAFKVDCCCLLAVTGDESAEISTANWCSEEYLELSHCDEILSMEQLMMSSPVVQCASEPLTIDDISISQKNLVIGCQSLSVPIKSVLAIPTRFNEQQNGIIILIKFQPYDWNESEKQLLKVVALSCAIALAQISQIHLLSTQKQYLQKTSQHQSLIKQLTILSLSNLEFNQMLQLVISSTAESLEADRGLLILLKYADPMFRNRPKNQIPKAKATVVGEWSKTNSVSATAVEKLEQSFWLSDCSLCQRVFVESGKPIMIDNFTEPKDDRQPNQLFAIEEFPTTLLMPLENQGKVLGFVVLQQETARNWQPAELNLVEMVCAQLSNAIIQSQTLRQVQNLVDERTEQLKRSLEVQAKLYEKTKQYVEQLQQLNELKDEFVSNISDRLRYPLTNMRMSIRNLRLPGISADRQSRYLDILESECTKEINLINDLLTLQKLESHKEAPQFESIDLNTKINEFVTGVEKQLTEKELTITVDLPKESLTLQTEIESFERILQELFTNVSKYSERDTVVHLQVSHKVEEEVDQVIIKVTNTGRGISQEEAAYIFDKFRRGKGRWIPGTGLGLALVKSLVQHLQGAIAIESTPITDSPLSEICFTLTLPQFSPPT